MTTLRLFTVAALALCLTACGKPSAHAADDPAFGEKVQAYLMAHPEVIEQAIGKLQEQKQAQAEQTAIAKIRSHKAALERDPRDFVVNPTGKITVVEFFDYQCGYCKLAAPEVIKLIKANPDIRFVFKDFVIFGPESEAAARAAIGAGRQGRYFEAYQNFMSEKAINHTALPRLLKASGVDDLAKAQAAGTDAAATQKLKDDHQLAMDIGLEGTPAFLVGETLVPGADMDALRAAIAKARGKAA
jgi:protein-disulfide isomerase